MNLGAPERDGQEEETLWEKQRIKSEGSGCRERSDTAYPCPTVILMFGASHLSCSSGRPCALLPSCSISPAQIYPGTCFASRFSRLVLSLAQTSPAALHSATRFTPVRKSSSVFSHLLAHCALIPGTNLLRGSSRDLPTSAHPPHCKTQHGTNRCKNVSRGQFFLDTVFVASAKY